MDCRDLKPGQKVRLQRRDYPIPSNGPFVVEEVPVKGLYRDYVKCRAGGGRAYYFLPEEIRPVTS